MTTIDTQASSSADAEKGACPNDRGSARDRFVFHGLGRVGAAIDVKRGVLADSAPDRRVTRAPNAAATHACSVGGVHPGSPICS